MMYFRFEGLRTRTENLFARQLALFTGGFPGYSRYVIEEQFETSRRERLFEQTKIR